MSEVKVRVDIHKDGDGPEYVLRLVKSNGDYMGIGSLNGFAEAELVQSILQGAIELHEAVKVAKATPGSALQPGWRKGMKNADNIVEGRLIEEFF